MKLFGSYTSPFVRHCRIVLMQSKFNFEFIEADEARRKEYSATDKVPFFTDGDLILSDSSSIVKYVREKSGRVFLADIIDFETYTITNTLLDSAINLFLLENEGFGPDSIKYLGRQKARVDNGLTVLNERIDPLLGITQDSALRCACFIGWGLFRDRFSINGLPNLRQLMEAANNDQDFVETVPHT